jgi:hypothetical protein
MSRPTWATEQPDHLGVEDRGAQVEHLGAKHVDETRHRDDPHGHYGN